VDARLYLVLDGRNPEPVLAAALASGVDLVQLRDKELGDDELVETARIFRRAADEHGALFVLNDRPDLVAACRADGVHVGQEDTPVAEARRIVGPGKLIGLSTHSPEQIAAAEGVDYISVGPVWETPTKPGRPAVGLELVAEAARTARFPFFAIGGIDESNVNEVVAAGATRIAVVRAIRDAADPGAAAWALRSALP
jgi:thiamine-phosphate pyrophosphorylase